MSWKISTAVLAPALLFATMAGAQMPSKPATAVLTPSMAAPAPGCEPSDKIDGTTIEMAHAKLAAAGFSQITELKKACDNFWHSRAMKDGAAVNVNLSPVGKVMIEGN